MEVRASDLGAGDFIRVEGELRDICHWHYNDDGTIFFATAKKNERTIIDMVVRPDDLVELVAKWPRAGW